MFVCVRRLLYMVFVISKPESRGDLGSIFPADAANAIHAVCFPSKIHQEKKCHDRGYKNRGLISI